MSSNLPEPPYRQVLRDIAAGAATTKQQLTSLTLHAEQGPDVVAVVGPGWQPVAGRPGVECYHVPHPDGLAGLFVGVFRVAAGTHFEGSSMDESRLVVALAGDIELNGQPLPPGHSRYLAPGEPASWQVQHGHLSVTIYDVPPHNINPELFPTS